MTLHLQAETPAAENGGAAEQFGEAAAVEEEWAGEGWAGEQQGGELAEPQEQQPPQNGEVAGWGQQASEEQPPAEAPVIDPEADIWKAVVLFTFQANNEDEIGITENEQVDILVKECDEDGWVKVRNAAGQVGYAPTNYLEVYASERLPEPAAPEQEGWAGQPMQTIPESGEPGGWAAQAGGWGAQPAGVEPNSSEEEEEGETEAETEDELPPGQCRVVGLLDGSKVISWETYQLVFCLWYLAFADPGPPRVLPAAAAAAPAERGGRRGGQAAPRLHTVREQHGVGVLQGALRLQRQRQGRAQLQGGRRDPHHLAEPQRAGRRLVVGRAGRPLGHLPLHRG